MRTSLLLLGLITISFMSCKEEKEYLLYVGTYSVENSKGIYCYDYNPDNGHFSFRNVTPDNENPSYLAISPNGQNLYAVSEIEDYNHMDSGSVTAYKIKDDGELEKINQEATLGKHPAHVTVSPDGKTVVAANYTSGSLSIYDVEEGGALGNAGQLIQHTGHGPDSVRQEGPHAHSSLFTADGKFLVSADLGTDKVDFYEYSADSNAYVHAKQGFVQMNPGFGPRHFDFSPDGRFIYVMNEMGSAVTVLQKDSGEYRIIQTLSSIPSDFKGENTGADIHLSKDGRFVYCSNRGHNSIAVFSRNPENGKIEMIQDIPVEGNWPRNFAIGPEGNFLLVANQKSNNITLFSIDKESGKLSFTGVSEEIPSPVCLKFLVR